MVTASIVYRNDRARASQPSQQGCSDSFTNKNGMSRSYLRQIISKNRCLDDRKPRTSLETASLETDDEHSIQFVDIVTEDLESNQSEPGAES